MNYETFKHSTGTTENRQWTPESAVLSLAATSSSRSSHCHQHHTVTGRKLKLRHHLWFLSTIAFSFNFSRLFVREDILWRVRDRKRKFSTEVERYRERGNNLLVWKWWPFSGGNFVGLFLYAFSVIIFGKGTNQQVEIGGNALEHLADGLHVIRYTIQVSLYINKIARTISYNFHGENLQVWYFANSFSPVPISYTGIHIIHYYDNIHNNTDKRIHFKNSIFFYESDRSRSHENQLI